VIGRRSRRAKLLNNFIGELPAWVDGIEDPAPEHLDRRSETTTSVTEANADSLVRHEAPLQPSGLSSFILRCGKFNQSIKQVTRAKFKSALAVS
jgi:hypothetical protein